MLASAFLSVAVVVIWMSPPTFRSAYTSIRSSLGAEEISPLRSMCLVTGAYLNQLFR